MKPYSVITTFVLFENEVGNMTNAYSLRIPFATQLINPILVGISTSSFRALTIASTFGEPDTINLSSATVFVKYSLYLF